MSDLEKPESCESCNNKNCALICYRKPLSDKNFWLCFLCASTDAGSAQMHPYSSETETVKILQTICFVGNEIINEIKKLNNR